MTDLDSGILNSRKQLSRIMILGGVLGLLFGGIHLASVSFSEFQHFFDGIFYASYGVLSLIGAVFVAKGRVIAIIFPIISVLASLVYSYEFERGFNYVSLIAGGVFIAWTIFLWRRGALS